MGQFAGGSGWLLLLEFVEAASTFWQRFNAAGKFNAAAIFAEAALDLASDAIWPLNASRAWPQMVASVHD
ncbi:MAG: hypothetical protein ACHP8B_04480 [Terriglobales bacterium]